MVEFHVNAEWDRLRAVALVRPTNFTLVTPVNATQRRFFATPEAPSREGIAVRHEAVRTALEREGVAVVDVPPLEGAALQFFARDPAAVIGSRLVLGRMGAPVRAAEPGHVARALRVDAEPPAAGCFEGGDVIVTPAAVFVGLGERTDERGRAALRTDREVVPVPLADGVLHLDVAMNLLNPGLGVIYRPAIRELPRALDHVRWIEVTEREFLEQGANVLSLAPGRVMMDARHTRLREALTAHGLTCVPLDLTEITKVGGGIRCLTLPLSRSETPM